MKIKSSFLLPFIMLCSIIASCQTVKNGSYVHKSKYATEYHVNYKNDTLNGAYKLINGDGLVVVKGNFNMGYRDGITIKYSTPNSDSPIDSLLVLFNNGTKVYEEFYLNGEVYMKSFYKNNLFEKTIQYKNGQPILTSFPVEEESAIEGYVDEWNKIN